MGLSQRLADRSFRQRLKSVQFLFLVAILGILVRSLYLQIYLKDSLEKRAARQYEQAQDIQLQRGIISDANGALLAVSLPMQSLFVIPPEVNSAAEEARNLAPVLGVGGGVVFRKLTAAKNFSWLGRRVHPLIADRVMQMNEAGVHSLLEYKRFYPLGAQASQLLGFVGVDSKGLEGLEYRYNHHLMDGSDREETWSHFMSGASLARLSGGSIRLSIDSRLQYYVESELSKGVVGLGAKNGVALLMETKTGRILAMASVPHFDPNRYGAFAKQTYFNRAIGAAYEPGSTFKIVTIAAALKSQVVAPDDFFFCENGSYKVQDRVIHDTQPHGWMSLEKIIQKSSNIGAAKIGALIPRPEFYQTIRDLGFGKKTRLALPAESAGKVYPTDKWTQVKVATMSYGHAISATPVQMTAAINTIANQGVYVEPRVVDQLQSADGETLPLASQTSRMVFDPKVTKQVTEYMFAVTQDGGTGRQVQVPGLDIAGKSGTSRKFDPAVGAYSLTQHISSFIGFFPAQQPWVTLYVMVDEPNKYYLGSKSAVPIFREIANKIKDLNPVLSSEFTAPSTALMVKHTQRLDKTPVLGKNRTIRQIKRLIIGGSFRDAQYIAGREGLQIRVIGSGLVRDVRVDPNNADGYLLFLSL